MTRAGLGVLVAALAAFAGQVSGQQTPPQLFRSLTQGVSVDVSVFKGRTPLSGLSIGDFVLIDDGVLQHVQMTSAASVPLDVSLTVDVSLDSVMGPKWNPTPFYAFASHADTLAHLLTPTDRIRVITFADTVSETRAMLPAGSRALKLLLENPTSGAGSGDTRVSDALLYALAWPTAYDRRHLVVLFSTAFDFRTVLPRDELQRVAERTEALLHVVLKPQEREPVTNLTVPFFAVERATRAALTEAAQATGGDAHITGDAAGALREILTEFRNSYVLSYTAQGVPASGWHTIDVTVPQCPNCTVHARKGYFGG